MAVTASAGGIKPERAVPGCTLPGRPMVNFFEKHPFPVCSFAVGCKCQIPVCKHGFNSERAPSLFRACFEPTPCTLGREGKRGRNKGRSERALICQHFLTDEAALSGRCFLRQPDTPHAGSAEEGRRSYLSQSLISFWVDSPVMSGRLLFGLLKAWRAASGRGGKHLPAEVDKMPEELSFR